MGGFNGSGTYVRYYNWTNDANSSIDISASRMDTEDNGYATGLSNVICRDGQSTISANIPWNNKKITGLGAGTAATDAAQLGQVSKGSVNYAVDSGAVNAIVLTMSPVNAALTDGQRVYFMAAANNTGATTLAVDGLGSTPALVTSNLSALVGGEIVANGMYEAEWSATNSKWVLLNPSVVTTGQIKAGAVDLTSKVTGTLPVANGGTGQTTYTDGQLLIGKTTGNTLNKATLTAGTGITITNGSGIITIATSGPSSSPTRQYLTSGSSATYTTPTNCTKIIVRMIGAGGGAAGSGTTTAPNGSQGGTTSFNSITAIGGLGGTGTLSSNGTGGAGGSGGTGATTLRFSGNTGSSATNGGSGSAMGGSGAPGLYGFGSGAGTAGTGNPTGAAGAANSGAGGGGVVHVSSTFPSGGGGSGEYAEFTISSPASTYTYTVGTGGAGGIGTGTNAQTGGSGGSGLIIVDEYY